MCGEITDIEPFKDCDVSVRPMATSRIGIGVDEYDGSGDEQAALRVGLVEHSEKAVNLRVGAWVRGGLLQNQRQSFWCRDG